MKAETKGIIKDLGDHWSKIQDASYGPERLAAKAAFGSLAADNFDTLMEEIWALEQAKERGTKALQAHQIYSFGSRGVGLDGCPGCFICGGEQDLYNNISGFVASKEDGEKIQALFQTGARLDFRPSEPNWIQVKIGACGAHLPQLNALHKLTHEAGKYISALIIQRAQQVTA